jgi:hypothetical protein
LQITKLIISFVVGLFLASDCGAFASIYEAATPTSKKLADFVRPTDDFRSGGPQMIGDKIQGKGAVLHRTTELGQFRTSVLPVSDPVAPMTLPTPPPDPQTYDFSDNYVDPDALPSSQIPSETPVPPQPQSPTSQQPPIWLPGLPAPIPNLPHGAETSQDRAARCMLQSQLYRVPPADYPQYIGLCTQ